MNNLNNLVCDMTTGVCGEAGEETMEIIDLTRRDPSVQLYYVTDPICSHCWALEPVLRKFLEQYGQYVKVNTIMGGLLPSWDGFGDASNGIGQPADVAGHWREVGEHSRMPIDGSLWLDNPIMSSYPPSRVFKVIQQQDGQLAELFLRRAREALFAFNRNIGDDQVLIDIVNQMGLAGEAIVKEAGLPAAQQLLEEDFALAGSLGVRGFPSIIMVNEEQKGVKITGARPFEHYVNGLKQALSEQTVQPASLPSFKQLLDREQLLFSKEIEVFYDLDQQDVSSFIDSQLSSDDYTSHNILGEQYVTSSNN